jgi:secreted trypsin-like serine protease
MHSLANRASALLVAAALTVPALPSRAQEGAPPEANPIDRVPEARAKWAAENPDEGDRVFGGHEAEPGAWPFQVALLSSGKLDANPASQPNAQFCGGSLIAPTWVLTAAHCLVSEGTPVPAGSITVLTEATNLAEGKRYEVAEVIVNENYSEMTLDNDIGLLRLKTAASAPMIPIAENRVPDSGTSTVIGWGRTDDGTFPNDLMQAEIELQPNDACNAGIKAIYARDLGVALRQLSGRMRYTEDGVNEGIAAVTKFMRDPLTDNMICAGTASGQRDACNGDSGGPLFMVGANGPEQVGVVSWGEGPFDAEAACGHANAYGVYTRLSNYKDWIAAKMASAPPAPEEPEGGTVGAGTGTLQKPKP